MRILNRGKVDIDDESKPLIDFSILPGEDSDAELLYFNWRCTKVGDKFIEYFLKFEFTNQISAFDSKENV